MIKKVAAFIASILLIGAIFASPHIYERIQFNNGNMLKIIESHDAQPNDQGGFVKVFTVQDNNGNTYNVYTGFVAQWNKSANDYINIKYIKE